MNTTKYNEFRDELKSLAVEASGLQGLDERTREKLLKLRDSVFRDEFKIVLISPFQGGKSTIFDTICGGEEISPTGIGIKTSACVCEAHYLEEGESFAQVAWRSDQELLLGFIDLLLEDLRKNANADFVDEINAGFVDEINADFVDEISAAEALNLSRIETRHMLRCSIDRVSKAYNANKAEHGSDYADRLGIAHLTMRHYEAFKLKQSDEQQKYHVHDISQWVHFPAKWGSPDVVAMLPLEKVMFLFIAKAEFWLDSPELKELAAVVVDCPGLNASIYDTQVAQRCIRESTAIMYLLGTNGTALSSSGLESIRSFARFGLRDGVFFGCNAKGVSSKQASHILENHDLCKLKELDLTVSIDTIPRFNALLACRTKQFPLMKNGQLSAFTLEKLATKAELQLSPKMLDKHPLSERRASILIEEDLRNAYKAFTGDSLEDLSAESLQMAEKDSNWKQVILQASRFIVQRRGRGMLVDRGSDVLHRALAEFHATLENRENAARASAEEMAREKKKAETALRVFEDRSDGVKERFKKALQYPPNFGESPGHLVYSELVQELQGILASAKTHRELKHAVYATIEEAQFERELQKRVPQTVQNFLISKIEGWQKNLADGHSTTAKNHIFEQIKKAEKEMAELLVEALTAGGFLLKGLDLGKLSVDSKEFEKEVTEKRYKGREGDRALNWLEGVKLLGPIVVFGRNLYESARARVTGHPFDRSAHKKAWENEIPNLITSDDLSNAVRKNVAFILSGYSAATDQAIDAAIRKSKTTYEKRLEERKSIFEKEQNSRKTIECEAKETRETLIEPFQSKVKAFSQRVKNALDESDITENE